MKNNKKGYTGFWKHLGCTLVIIAFIGVCIVIYMLLRGALFKL